MKPNCIFIVLGNTLKEDFSNVVTIDTKIIPNVGEEIYFQKTSSVVKRKVINYAQVEDYDLDNPNRGKEVIYIFI